MRSPANRAQRRAFRRWYKTSSLHRPFLIPHKIEWEDILASLFQHRHYARGRMLDIGSRNRRYEELFREITASYRALDLYDDAIHNSRGIDIYGDATRLPIADGTVDTVLMTQVLGAVFDCQLVLKEVFRVLSPGGCLILTHSQHAGVFHPQSDYFRFTVHFYRHALKETGFEIEILHPRSGTLAMVGETLSTIVYYRWERAGIPHAIRLLVCYPLQLVFRFLDNIWFDDTEPLGHLVIARKPNV